MFGDYLLDKLGVDYENRILVFDEDHLLEKSGILPVIVVRGFELVSYSDPLQFRCLYEERLRDNSDTKVIVQVRDTTLFVPYDIRKRFHNVRVDFPTLFPRLDAGELRRRYLDLDLLHIAYQNCFGGSLGAAGTREFVETTLYDEAYAAELIGLLSGKIRQALGKTLSYREWFGIAQDWARIRVMVDGGFADHQIDELAREIDEAFRLWMLEHFHELSASPNVEGPVILHKANDYMRARSERLALIVVDGLSVENWLTILYNHAAFPYYIDVRYCFAFVPTVTAVSRQSLFSGKLPVSHCEPFSLKNEQRQWIEFWTEKGYVDRDVFFGRGVDVDIPYHVKIAGIIINFVDDLMHGQIQGQNGMYRDVASWARQGDFQRLVQRLISQGFDVYVTSDHGNIEAKGENRPQKEGLLTEMTSLRARVYQGFANTDALEENSRVFRFPGVYLPKEYQYIICEGDAAFGESGRSYVCHGGMSIEEVIVPFTRIKGCALE